jgi:hypothetical protein
VTPMDMHPPETDLPYLEADFVELPRLAAAHGRPAEVVREEVAGERMPQPTYVLSDGRELVPPDYFALAEAAGGASRLRDWFSAAYEEAAREHDADPPDMAWRDYVSGGYGACLRSITPVTIVRKTVLVTELERLLAEPHPQDQAWIGALRPRVDALDALERPFCAFDRRHGPVTRDRLITAARERYLT